MSDTPSPLSRALTAPGASKVPATITGVFWVAKLFSTAFGETTSDWMVQGLGAPIAVFAGFVLFALALWLQLRSEKYLPWLYWTAVSMVAIFGTMAADVLHKGMGIPYVVTTIGFGIVLAVVFVVWARVEKTLSIHSITTMRRELFYWAAVIATFALGTAAGDMTASTFNLGYLASAGLFTVIFLIPAVGYWTGRLDAVFAFWFAYVFTRPIGASIADWLEKPKAASGLGLPYGVAFVLLLIGLLITVAVQQHRWQAERRRHAHRHPSS
jgi:uncharacterized membrane-anchored protein